MQKLVDLNMSSEELNALSLKIKDDIYKPANTFKTTIFLCGADIAQSNKLRSRIAKSITDKWFSYQYDIIYPESIFEELLYSSQSRDLLSLENLLAESVDAIILIPESPGSFAELGAFANNEKLRLKIICVVDKIYRKNKSFINQGPLKLIRKANQHGVLYIDPDDIETAVDRIRTLLAKIKKNSNKNTDKISLLQLDNFLLAAIYLLEPVVKGALVRLVATATRDEQNSFQATTTALTILMKSRLIELTPSGFKLTMLGVEMFENLRRQRKRSKSQEGVLAIDDLRLEILNLQLRNKKMKL